MEMPQIVRYFTTEGHTIVIDAKDITCVLEKMVGSRPKAYTQEYLFDNGRTLETTTNKPIWEETNV